MVMERMSAPLIGPLCVCDCNPRRYACVCYPSVISVLHNFLSIDLAQSQTFGVEGQLQCQCLTASYFITFDSMVSFLVIVSATGFISLLINSSCFICICLLHIFLMLSSGKREITRMGDEIVTILQGRERNYNKVTVSSSLFFF